MNCAAPARGSMPRSTTSRWARSPARSARTRPFRQASRNMSASNLGCAPMPVSTQIVQRDRHAQLQCDAGAHRLVAGEDGAGDSPPAAHRAGRGVRAIRRADSRDRRRCRTSAIPRSASASAGWRACCAASASRRWRTWRSGTSATSATPPPSASSCRMAARCCTTCSGSSTT